MADQSTEKCSIGYRKNISDSKLNVKAGLKNTPFDL